MWSETVTVVRVTEMAALCDYEGVEAWIPFSQILDNSEICNASEEGDEGKLCIPDWLAEEKDWVF